MCTIGIILDKKKCKDEIHTNFSEFEAYNYQHFCI